MDGGDVLPGREEEGPRQPGGAGVLTVLATLSAGAVLMVVSHPVTAVAGVVVLAVLTVLAWRTGSDEAVDAAVMGALLYAAVAVGVLGLWPVPGVVAVLTAWLLARGSTRARLWRSWLRRGRVTPELPWLLVITVVVAAVALVAWQRLFAGKLPAAYVEASAGRPLVLLLLAGVTFSLVNAAVEEAIFRGVLQTALERVSGPMVAIVVQAVAFGTLHVLGVPTGMVGAMMAGLWGVLLGVMRWRTGGLLAPYLAHLAADITIFAMLLPSLR